MYSMRVQDISKKHATRLSVDRKSTLMVWFPFPHLAHRVLLHPPPPPPHPFALAIGLFLNQRLVFLIRPNPSQRAKTMCPRPATTIFERFFSTRNGFRIKRKNNVEIRCVCLRKCFGIGVKVWHANPIEFAPGNSERDRDKVEIEWVFEVVELDDGWMARRSGAQPDNR